MKKRRSIKRVPTALSDFLMGMLLGILAFCIGNHASASDIDRLVNSKIKEEFIRMDVDQLRANVEYNRPDTSNSQPEAIHGSQPLNSKDTMLDNIDPIGLGENSAAVDHPQGSISKKLDPFDPIEQKIAEKQAYDLFREHYRGAVQ